MTSKTNARRALPNLQPAPVVVTAPPAPRALPVMSHDLLRRAHLRAKLDEQNARIAAQCAAREAAEKDAADKLATDLRIVAMHNAKKARAEKIAALTGKPLAYYWSAPSDFTTIGANGEPIAIFANGVYRVLAKARGNAPMAFPVPRGWVTAANSEGNAARARAAWQDVPLRKDSRITLTGKGDPPRDGSKARVFFNQLSNGMTAAESYKTAGDLLPRSTLAASLQRFVVAGVITLT